MRFQISRSGSTRRQAGAGRPRSRRPAAPALLAPLVLLGLLAGACGGDSPGDDAARPSIVVTTSILGDVVSEIVGGLADVEVIMPPGVGPHEFQASVRQAVAMREADVLVVNGLGFEAGLDKVVDAARRDGVDVYDASSAIEPRLITAGDEKGTPDPHYFTSVSRMIEVSEGIAAHLREALPSLAGTRLDAGVARYVAALRGLRSDIEAVVAPLPEARRKLVTNHDVFGYFADEFGFEVIDTVIPNLSTQAEPSARGLEELAATIEAEDVPAIFADTSSSSALADKLADLVGQVEVVELYSESLGPAGSEGDTYLKMMSTNAQRIATALS